MIKETVILAKEYSKRDELENHIRGISGCTVDPKSDIHIEGTRAEMDRLGLSDRTTFWGIKCVITDTPTIPTAQKDADRPVRGEIKDFGMNGATKPPKDKK